MVATAGRGWKLAPSLIQLVVETDERYPDRDRRSDGSIGDAAHAARQSDHNPYEGWVHAVDLDEDLEPGRDLADFVAHLVSSRDPRIRYLIYEGRIVKSYVDSAGRIPWLWHPYTGPNAHTQHLHVSINRAAAAREDLSPWWPPRSTGGSLMALTDAEQRELLEAVRDVRPTLIRLAGTTYANTVSILLRTTYERIPLRDMGEVNHFKQQLDIDRVIEIPAWKWNIYRVRPR